MRTLRRSVALLAALSVTVVAAGVSAQGEPVVPGETPAEEVPPEGVTPPEGADPAQPGDSAEPTEPAPPEPVSPEPPKPLTEANCTDGIDDDGDGMIDCGDSDCASDTACKPAEPAPIAVEPAPIAVEPAPAPKDPEADVKKEEPPPETTLGLEGLMGITGRLGSVSSGYDASERAGLQYGAGVLFAPNRQFAFGLSYIYSGLGVEEFDPSVSDTNGRIDRRLHNVAALLRAYPLRSDTVGLWAGLNLGLTWQTASARGSVQSGTIATPAVSYLADVGPKAGLALGASLGLDLDLGSDLAMLTSVNFTNHRLSSDVLEGDAGDPLIPGIGSVSQLDIRLAFQYRFDLSGADAPVSVEAASR